MSDAEKLTFKLSQPGLRKLIPSAHSELLVKPKVSTETYTNRKSSRIFDANLQLPIASVQKLLQLITPQQDIQVFVEVKGVEGVAQGKNIDRRCLY